MTFPRFVKVVEVGPRDGLQNETQAISSALKVDFIDRLSETGLSSIEVTSMVSPKWLPQLADGEEVFRQIQKRQGVSYPILIPNCEGLTRALSVGVDEIAVFTSASEAFCQKNTHCSIDESLARIEAVLNKARSEQLRVRAY